MARPVRLDDAAIARWLSDAPAWARDGDTLTRTYTMKDFSAAIAFVVKVGILAEKMDHHPDISIAYRNVTLRFSTHDAGGITELDLAGAKGADELA